MLGRAGVEGCNSACVEVDPGYSGQAVRKDAQHHGRRYCVSKWLLAWHVDLLLEINQAENDG
jgi:hypothetical protein